MLELCNQDLQPDMGHKFMPKILGIVRIKIFFSNIVFPAKKLIIPTEKFIFLSFVLTVYLKIASFYGIFFLTIIFVVSFSLRRPDSLK